MALMQCSGSGSVRHDGWYVGACMPRASAHFEQVATETTGGKRSGTAEYCKRLLAQHGSDDVMQQNLVTHLSLPTMAPSKITAGQGAFRAPHLARTSSGQMASMDLPGPFQRRWYRAKR